MDSDELDDIGYVILGAKRGELVGGISELANDAQCASLPRSLNNYITPNARIEVRSYQDPEMGWFGAILIRPSGTMRPHFVRREYSSDDTKHHVRRNECYVRLGESVELASREDFDRMYQQKFETQSRAVEGNQDPEPAPLICWLQNDEPLSMIVMPPTRPLTSFDVTPPADDSFAVVEMTFLPDADAKRARKYNDELTRYRGAVDAAKEELKWYERAHSNLNAIYVACENDGEAPLLNYNVHLEFPEGFELFEPIEPPKPPRLPSRPIRPQLRPAIIDRLGLPRELDVGAAAAYLYGSRNDSSFVSSLAISGLHREAMEGCLLRKGKRSASGWAAKTRHGYRMRLGPILVVPPEREDIYEVEYAIHADNLRRPLKGTLKLKVQNGAEQLLGAVEHLPDISTHNPHPMR